MLPVDVVNSKEKEQGSVAIVATEEKSTTDGGDEEVKQRKEKVRKKLREELDGTPGQEPLGDLLEEYHDVFCLNKEDEAKPT